MSDLCDVTDDSVTVPVTSGEISTEVSNVSDECILLENSPTEVIDLIDEQDEVVQNSSAAEINITPTKIKNETVSILLSQGSAEKKNDNESDKKVVCLGHINIDSDDSNCEPSASKLKVNGEMTNQGKKSDSGSDFTPVFKMLSDYNSKKSPRKKRKSFKVRKNGSTLKKRRASENKTLLIGDDSNQDYSDLKTNFSPAESSKQSVCNAKKETSANLSVSSDVIVLDSDDECVNLDDSDISVLTARVPNRKRNNRNVSVEILSDKVGKNKSVKQELKSHDVSVEILSEIPAKNRPAPVLSSFIPLTEEVEDNNTETPVQDENLFFEDKRGMGVRFGNRDDMQVNVKKRLNRDELPTTAKKRSHINRFEKKPISRFERMKKISQNLKKQDNFSKQKDSEVQCLFTSIQNSKPMDDNETHTNNKGKDKHKTKGTAASSSTTTTKDDVEVIDVNEHMKNVYNPETSHEKTGLRPIIIDGSNVALGHTNGKEFSCRGLAICIDYFAKQNHRVIAFVPKFRRSQAHSVESHILEKYEDANQVVYTPSRWLNGRLQMSYDDRYIVQCAAELGGVIVSTDNFRDLSSENPSWREAVEKRLLMFTWVGDMLMFPQDPLGRHGPSLAEFLRFPE